MSDRREIQLDNGKYTYVFDGGKQYALRHGEPWRDLLGDKFVYCLAHEVSRLQEEVDGLKSEKEVATTLPDEVRNAINHAMDVLSKHGDGFTSAGAMAILESFLEHNPAQPRVL